MKQKIALLILIFAGLVFLALSLPSVIRTANFKKHGVYTESTVVRSNRISSSKGPSTYDVTVSFNTPDGNQVVATARKRSYIADGNKVMIYYDPAAPQKIDFGDSIAYNMRGVLVSGFIILLGFYLLFRAISRERANNKLIRSGKKIAAEFVSVDRNEKFRMGDKNPWIIKCKWIDIRNNQEYYFVSKDYTIDPVPYLKERKYIDVFIDPSNPGKYYMDTSFMPKGD